LLAPREKADIPDNQAMKVSLEFQAKKVTRAYPDSRACPARRANLEYPDFRYIFNYINIFLIKLNFINFSLFANQLLTPSHTQGQKGEPGQPGIPGKRGEDGLPGPPGLAGAPGYPGEKGDTCLPGLPGMKGELGMPGFPGPKGDLGYPGSAGLPGLPGPKGESGYPGGFNIFIFIFKEF
jgi:hypothetical protein